MNEFTTPRPPVAPARKLVRDPDNVFGGVAAGLGHHLDIDVALVRLAFIFAFLAFGIGPIFYVIAWLILPIAQQPLGRTDYLGGIPS